MSYAKTQKLIDEKLKQYNEEEFYNLINFIDNKELIKPIKKKQKLFMQDIKGFRIDRLDKHKLKEIYFKHVYKKREPILSAHLAQIINENELVLIDMLKSKLDVDELEDIAFEVENNNKNYIDKIISILLDTSYSENIMLCFKLMHINLDESTSYYIDETIKHKKIIKEEKKKVINDITIEFNKKLKEAEKNFNEIIKNKEKILKELNLSIDNINKKHILEIKNKEMEISKLKDKNIHKEKKFNLEIEKLNIKIVNLEEKLQKYIEEKDKLKKIIEENEEKNSKLSNLLEDKYSRFDKYAELRWKNENENLLSENRNIENNIVDLELYKQSIKDEISILKKDKDSVENAINLLENNSKEFIENISYVMNRIGRNNIVDTTENSIFEHKYKVSSNINHIQSTTIEEEPETKEDKFDFINDLAENFKFIGIGNDYIYDLAKYIYATIANKMGLFIIGYNNRLFANAISYLICNSSVDIVVIPPGFIDSKDLIEKVNNTQSKVVLIENAIDNIAESVYMPLLKDNKDKILIFSMESNENISIAPKSIFNYLMLVDLDPILESDQTEELYTSITPNDIFEIDKNNKEKRSKLSKGLNSSIDLGNVSKLKMIEVNNIINNLDSEKDTGIYSLLLFSIGMISKSQNRYDNLEKFIKNQNFERDRLDILNFVIGMDDQYE